jgi:hypothetical protein
MRFGEYAARHGIAVDPVDRFAGFVVSVSLPAGWELFRSGTGIWVWGDSNEKSSGGFCANAVLTMHRAAAGLAEDEVFTMLGEEQAKSVPGCREDHRDFAVADDGIGVRGLLQLQIQTHEFGAIDSASRSHIIRYGDETMIAQLTATAHESSAIDQAGFALSVRPGAAPSGVSVWAGDVQLA